jgi:hypothetical protein
MAGQLKSNLMILGVSALVKVLLLIAIYLFVPHGKYLSMLVIGLSSSLNSFVILRWFVIQPARRAEVSRLNGNA